jgi:threonine aldolase
MDKVDFRSDTVTWPTEAMRAAMAGARVGDDVYGEDPTVIELEETAAARVGKEAALFVASGTMGNLVAILTHARRGDEAIVGADAHTIRWEAGGMAVLGGVVPKPLPTDVWGRMDIAAIEDAVSENDPHLPRTRLVLLENSYGARNGFPLPPEYFASVRDVADRHGLAIHLDGARLFNAAVALDLAPQAVTRHVDSVSFCLSKGLSAPVGSVLCGTEDFVKEARRARKLVGGGMRQAGVVAAAGLVALEKMVDRLAMDHTRARRLADGIRSIPGLVVLPPEVRTNIVYFELEDSVPYSAADIVETLQREDQIWLGSAGERRFRAVTHTWIGDEDVTRLLEALRKALT